MNQKCQRKREEEASQLANAVDNQPMSTQTISQATEAAPAPAPAATEAAPTVTTTEAAPEAAAAPAATTTEATAAPAATTTDVSVPVPEQPKKLVGCFALA